MINKQEDFMKIRLFKENRKASHKNILNSRLVKWVIKSICPDLSLQMILNIVAEQLLTVILNVFYY